MSKDTWDHIKSYEKQFIAGDSIALIWNIEDVVCVAEDNDYELTDDQARDVLSLLVSKHDATIGINWDVIECWIEMYLNDPKYCGAK